MSSYVTRKTPGDTTWFTHDRFGMFIHWGLYAMPARHEWVKTRERMTDDHYDRYFRHFDPDLYDPRQWARMAKAAGPCIINAGENTIGGIFTFKNGHSFHILPSCDVLTQFLPPSL